MFFTSALDGGRWSAFHAGRFASGKKPQHALNRRLSRPHGRSGRFGEETNSHDIVVSVLTELRRELDLHGAESLPPGKNLSR